MDSFQRKKGELGRKTRGVFRLAMNVRRRLSSWVSIKLMSLFLDQAQREIDEPGPWKNETPSTIHQSIKCQRSVFSIRRVRDAQPAGPAATSSIFRSLMEPILNPTKLTRILPSIQSQTQPILSSSISYPKFFFSRSVTFFKHVTLQESLTLERM